MAKYGDTYIAPKIQLTGLSGEELMKQAMARKPTTLNTKAEIDNWTSNNVLGKSPRQLEVELQDPFFGVSGDNYYDYASDYIQELNATMEAKGQPRVSIRQQEAILDLFRQKAGEDPIHYTVGPEGASPRDAKFYELRQNRTTTSAWDNFSSNFTDTVMRSALGPVQFLSKMSDELGITDDATNYWEQQTEEMSKILSPQGGASGFAGSLAGSMMYSFLTGAGSTGLGKSLGGKVPGFKGQLPEILRKGWKGGVERILKHGGPMGLAFGVGTAGQRFGEIARRKAEGQDISLGQEYTFALGGGAVEAMGEMVGWSAALGLGRVITKNIGELTQATSRAGLSGFIKELTRVSTSNLGHLVTGTAQGATEETMTQIGQNLIDKYTGVAAETGAFAGVGQAALGGALQPLILGGAMGVLGKLQRGDDTSLPEIMDDVEQLETIKETVTAAAAVELGKLEAEEKEAVSFTEDEQDMVVSEIHQKKEAILNALPVDERNALVGLARQGEEAGTEDKGIKGIVGVFDRGELAHHSHHLAKGMRSRMKDVDPKITNKKLTRIQKMYEKLKAGEQYLTWSYTDIITMTEALDGYGMGPKGEVYQTLYRPGKQTAVQGEENGAVRVGEFVQHMIDVIGIDMNSFTSDIIKTRSGNEFTRAERTKIRMMARTEASQKRLLNTGQVSEQDLNDILQDNSEQAQLEIQAADWLLAQYKAQTQRFADAVYAATGKNIKIEDAYMPYSLRDPLADSGDQIDSAIAEIAGPPRTLSGKGVPEIGEMKSKKAGARQPLHLDAFGEYYSHVRKIERFIATAPQARIAKEIINNPKFSEAVNRLTGGNGVRILNKWVEDTVRGRPAAEKQAWLGWLDTMRRNAGVAILGINAVSSMKQIASLTTAMGFGKGMMGRIASNIAKNAVNHKEMHNFMMNNSKEMVHRNSHVDRELREMKEASSKKKALTKGKQWSDLAMWGIRFVDGQTVTVVWNSAYEEYAETHPNGSHEDAVEWADYVVTKTQPMSHVEDLPDFFRGGAIARALTQFQGPIRKHFNVLRHDIIGARMAGKISNREAMGKFISSQILPALILGLIGTGFMPEDIENTALKTLAFPVTTIPLIGQGFNNMIQGYEGRIVALSFPEEVKKTYSSLTAKDVKYGRAIEHMLKAAGIAAGIPVIQPTRTIKGLTTLAKGETRDPRQLIWSQYALKKGKKKEEKKKPTTVPVR
jgi:hypothetical protein